VKKYDAWRAAPRVLQLPSFIPVEHANLHTCAKMNAELCSSIVERDVSGTYWRLL
jgi:hypothetical protein